MRKSRSGRTFSRKGVKQKHVVGCLMRSVGYGSRIVMVLGRTKVKMPEGGVCEYLIARHFCNTSHFTVPNPHDKSGKHPYTVNIKGNRQRAAEATYSSPFLTMVYGWDVVKEIK